MSSGDRRSTRPLRLTLARLVLVLVLLAVGTGTAQMQPPREPVAVALPACGSPQFEGEAAVQARAQFRPLTSGELRAQGRVNAQGELLTDAVGDQRPFWTINFAKSVYEQISATCMAVGEHCYVYLQQGQTLSGNQSQTIANIVHEFDTNIYAKDTSTFGTEPNPGVDGDPRVYILLLDIQDGWDGVYQRTYTAGYFDPGNEVAGAYSNLREMFFMDIYPATAGSTGFFGTLAHEFQHMIHWWHDAAEETWVNEGCSDLAVYLCGYGYPQSHLVSGNSSNPGFLESPDHQLTLNKPAWTNSMADYGSAFMWTLYLWEHYGGDGTITHLVANTQHGIQGVDSTLAARGQTDRFEQVFKKWVVANYIDEGTGPWGYASIQLLASGYDNTTTFQRPVIAATHSAYPVSSASRTVNYYAGAAIKLTGGSGQTLNLSFNGANDNRFATYVVRSTSANMTSGTNTVSEVTLNGSWDGATTVASMGGSTQAVLLIPESLAATGSKSYTYSATVGPAPVYDHWLRLPFAQRSAPLVQPTATPMPTATPKPTATPSPTPSTTGPRPGYWASDDGVVEFWVTADRKILPYIIYFTASDCYPYYFQLYTLSPVSITNNQYSFYTGSGWTSSGTFTSSTVANVVNAVSSLLIEGCGYYDIPTHYSSVTWRDNTTPPPSNISGDTGVRAAPAHPSPLQAASVNP
jgi:hypothetical protein